tara:strand:- start:5 stop:460 length:456 start_codon:yes stop_codon:yes gene_type:complete
MKELIRLAEAEDIDRCVALAFDMIAEGFYKEYDVDADDMMAHAKLTYEQPDWMFMVYEKEGEIVGFFSAQISKTFFGSDLIAEQRLMYIEPNHRGNLKVPMSFMRELRSWAALNKCKGIFFEPTVSIHSGFDIIAKRLGYDYVGPTYGRAP